MYVTCVWPEASGEVSSLSLLSPSLSLQSEVPSSSAVAGRGFSMSDAASTFRPQIVRQCGGRVFRSTVFGIRPKYTQLEYTIEIFQADGFFLSSKSGFGLC